MTDVTSEKLYSKLERINNVKRNFKKVMIAIGGYEYFQNDPKFETYPEILSTIHARIAGINRILDISIYGRDPSDVLSKPETTYNKIMPYLDELQYCRNLLIDNLNTKGVTADTTDTLRTLVGKVLDISSSGGAPEPFDRIIATQELTSHSNVVVDWHYVCNIHKEEDHYWGVSYSIRGNIKNNSDTAINLIDLGCKLTIGYNDGTDGVSCAIMAIGGGVIGSHSTWELQAYEHRYNNGTLEALANKAEQGDPSVFFEEVTCPVEEQRTETIELPAYCPEGEVEAYYTFKLLKFSSNEYAITGEISVSPHNYAELTRNVTVNMLAPDGSDRQYQLIEFDSGWNLYSADDYANTFFVYNEQEVEDFSYYMTNEIITSTWD